MEGNIADMGQFIGAGLAIGGQHKVNDYLTGLSVLFEDRYGVGDDLVVETAGRDPFPAVVEHVGLFTCSLVAVNIDTGKLVWYYQTSPRDMHDWDSAQTPIMIDAVINGKPRKLVSTAARNGYFFTVDRVTGKYVASGKYGMYTNWAKGLDSEGRPILDPTKVATIPGATLLTVMPRLASSAASAFAAPITPALAAL